MPRFRLETDTTGHEVYYITADNEAHARQIFETNAPIPWISEVTSCEVTEVEEVQETKT